MALRLHAHLRDVRGSLGVQLFHKPSEDVFGKIRHIFCVQEKLDDAHSGQPSTREHMETRLPPRLSVGSSSHHTSKRSGMNSSGKSSNGESSSSGSVSCCGFVTMRCTGRDDLLEISTLSAIICGSSIARLPLTTSFSPWMMARDCSTSSHEAPLLRCFQEGGTGSQRLTLQHTSAPRLTHRATCIIRGDGHALAARCLLLANV